MIGLSFPLYPSLSTILARMMSSYVYSLVTFVLKFSTNLRITSSVSTSEGKEYLSGKRKPSRLSVSTPSSSVCIKIGSFVRARNSSGEKFSFANSLFTNSAISSFLSPSGDSYPDFFLSSIL